MPPPRRSSCTRRGQLAGARRRRDRADRGPERGAERGHPPAVREGARGGLRRAPRRSFHWACRSCSRTWARRSPAIRSTWACGSSRRRGSERPPTPTWRSASALPGFVTVGKTNTPELGILPTTEPDAYGADPQPLGPGTFARRVERRLRGRRRLGHGAGGPRQRRRRLDPHPRERLRLVGLKPTGQRTSAGPLAGDQMSGLSEELVVSRSVRDTAAVLDAVHGSAAGGSIHGARAAAPLPRRVGGRARAAAGRADDQAAPGRDPGPGCC